jgi:hypothetical protein
MASYDVKARERCFGHLRVVAGGEKKLNLESAHIFVKTVLSLGRPAADGKSRLDKALGLRNRLERWLADVFTVCCTDQPAKWAPRPAFPDLVECANIPPFDLVG